MNTLVVPYICAPLRRVELAKSRQLVPFHAGVLRLQEHLR